MSVSDAEQITLTNIAVKAGQILHQHGAESRLIEQISQRIGIALGADSIELSISSDSIIITSICDGKCITTTRRCHDRGISMHMVCEALRICVMAEKQGLTADEINSHLDDLKPYQYNRWIIVLMVGLSCASFSHFFGADWHVYLTTFVAASCAMILRQELGARHHNPFVLFTLTAFLATTIAGIGVSYQFGAKPEIAMAAAVLLLVPGFPLINAASDMLKGHVGTGIARWAYATLLMLSASVGIMVSMSLTHVWGWIA